MGKENINKKKESAVKTFTVQSINRLDTKNYSTVINSSNETSKDEYIKKALNAHMEGNSSEAATCYQLCIDNGINDLRIYYNYGILLKNLGKFKEAKIYLLKAIEINPGLYDSHYQLSTILIIENKGPDIHVSVRKALRQLLWEPQGHEPKQRLVIRHLEWVLGQTLS